MYVLCRPEYHGVSVFSILSENDSDNVPSDISLDLMTRPSISHCVRVSIITHLPSVALGAMYGSWFRLTRSLGPRGFARVVAVWSIGACKIVSSACLAPWTAVRPQSSSGLRVKEILLSLDVVFVWPLCTPPDFGMTTSSNASAADFVAWFEAHNGFLDSTRMGIVDFPGHGRGAIALSDIPVRSR